MPRLLSTRYVSLERDAPFSSCVVDGNNSRRRPLSVDLSVTKKRAALSRHSPHLLKSGAGQAQKQCTQNRARAVHYFLSCPDLCSESFPMFCSEFVGGPINGGGSRHASPKKSEEMRHHRRRTRPAVKPNKNPDSSRSSPS